MDAVCPLCGDAVEPLGPAVASWRRSPDRAWRSTWVACVDDLPSRPARLVHPGCFARDEGEPALAAVLAEHERRRAGYRERAAASSHPAGSWAGGDAAPDAAVAPAGPVAPADRPAARRAPSAPATALKLLGVVAATSVLVALLIDTAPVVPVLIGSSVAVAVLLADQGARRTAGALAVGSEPLRHAALRLPVERFAVGRSLQVRFLRPARAVWAPGVLAVSTGRVDFVPSQQRRADRAWAGAVTTARVRRFPGNAWALRVEGPDGTAQFALSGAPDLRALLAPHLELAPWRGDT